jgi:hypothetical protein
MVLVVVPPVTNAVRVVDCPTIILVPTDEITATVTVFTALLLPQPAVRLAAAIAAATQFKSVRNFILPPPKQTRVAGMCARPVALTPPTSSSLAVAGIRKSG